MPHHRPGDAMRPVTSRWRRVRSLLLVDDAAQPGTAMPDAVILDHPAGQPASRDVAVVTDWARRWRTGEGDPLVLVALEMLEGEEDERALDVAVAARPDAILLVNLSGRGDKDVHTAARWFGLIDDDGDAAGLPEDDGAHEDADVADVAAGAPSDGAKGMGEICLIPTAPATAQAYYLRDGKRRYRLPLEDTAYRRPPRVPAPAPAPAPEH